jgi:hypothetical protein
MRADELHEHLLVFVVYVSDHLVLVSTDVKNNLLAY